MKWRAFNLLSGDEFLQRKTGVGLFSVSRPADETATKLLASMIYTGKVKEKYKTSIAAGFHAEPAATTCRLASLQT